MRLYLKQETEDGGVDYIDVSFWSFFKGYILSVLTALGLYFVGAIVYYTALMS